MGNVVLGLERRARHNAEGLYYTSDFGPPIEQTGHAGVQSGLLVLLAVGPGRTLWIKPPVDHSGTGVADGCH